MSAGGIGGLKFGHTLSKNPPRLSSRNNLGKFVRKTKIWGHIRMLRPPVSASPPSPGRLATILYGWNPRTEDATALDIPWSGDWALTPRNVTPGKSTHIAFTEEAARNFQRIYGYVGQIIGSFAKSIPPFLTFSGFRDVPMSGSEE